MVVAAQAEVVVVLTRAPSSGGKTRLFQSLGCDSDPSLLTALLLDTLDGVATSGVQRAVVVEPSDACDDVAALVPADVSVWPQSQGSLGTRMRDAMATAFAGGAARVALVGSDLPAITPRPLLDAFAALRRDPGSVVLGPAGDAGYYLVAADHVPAIFDDISWGTADVLSQTCRAAASAALRVHIVESLDDVDTRDGLIRLASADVAGGRRTREWIREHDINQDCRQDGKKDEM